MAKYDKMVIGMHHLNITQTGTAFTGRKSYSHPSWELDLAGSDAGIDYWFNKLPNTYFKCLGAFGTAGTKFYGSCDKNGNPKAVYCADGVTRVVTLAMTHSNKSFAVGKIYAPGEVMYQEGTKGRATGNHIHLEVATGWVKSKHYSNGAWNINGIMDPRKVFFVLDGYTTVTNAGGLNWKHCGMNDRTVTINEGSSSSKSNAIGKVNNWNSKYASGKTFTTTANLNFRDEKGKVLMVIPKGKKVTWYGGSNGSWYWVAYNGKSGYCSKDYLK